MPGESHGQRSLVGYSPQGHKESEMTERLHFTSNNIIAETYKVKIIRNITRNNKHNSVKDSLSISGYEKSSRKKVRKKID